MRSELDSDGYEEIGDGCQKQRYSRPTAMELIQPREGQHRTLWCEIPEVVNSRVLSKTRYVLIIVLERKKI
jgi:neuronal guanine nucleotide exchange factor